MSERKLAIIQTRIDGDIFVASTPNLPGVQATNKSESLAINDLLTELRRLFAAGPAEWIADPIIKNDANIITRKLSGVWPVNISENQLEPQPTEDVNLPGSGERTEDHGS